MSSDIGVAIQVHVYNPDDYLHERIHEMVDQNANSSSLLRDIVGANSRTLADPFRNYKNGCACSMMTVYFSSTVNPERAISANVMQNADGIKLLKAAIAWSCSIAVIGDTLFKC